MSADSFRPNVVVKFAYYTSKGICYEKICKNCEFVLTITTGFHVSTIIASTA